MLAKPFLFLLLSIEYPSECNLIFVWGKINLRIEESKFSYRGKIIFLYTKILLPLYEKFQTYGRSRTCVFGCPFFIIMCENF